MNRPSGHPQDDDGVSIENDDRWARGMLSEHAPAVAALLRARYPSFNVHDIEDLLIVAMTRLWRARARYDKSKSSPRTYFFRIADNVARNVLKSGWHKVRRLEVELGEKQFERAGSPSQTKAMDAANESTSGSNSELSQRLREIIDKLPEAYRQIVIADACAYSDVASSDLLSQELQLPAGTIRVYRNRAMKSIRTSLRNLGYEVP